MAYEQKPNSGAVFTNDKKEKDTHPDRKGDASLCCPKCGETSAWWLSGWVKQTQAGKQFLSLAFKPKDQVIPAAQTDGARVMPRKSADPDEFIPFAPEFR